MISGKTIFISPIDWGLGHATRCMPLIHALAKNNTIIIGVTPLNAAFFNSHFPGFQTIEVPSYQITYSRYMPLWLKLLLQWPKINTVIKKERTCLEKIISRYKIDMVISDNRYGFTHKTAHCVLITHQLNIKAPFILFMANFINRAYINKFNEVWVPDYKEKNLRLAGELSDPGKISIPVNYIGPQSALVHSTPVKRDSERSDYLILLSGVEPQRTILENILITRMAFLQKKIILVRGSNTHLSVEDKNIKVMDFCFGEQLRDLIVNADTVICRSGYSTLMDLHLLHKNKLILIPTPGQTEQEYLASYWHEKFGSEALSQEVATKFNFK